MSNESVKKSTGISRLEASSENSSCFSGGDILTQAPVSGVSISTVCWLIFLKYWIKVAKVSGNEENRINKIQVSGRLCRSCHYGDVVKMMAGMKNCEIT